MDREVILNQTPKGLLGFFHLFIDGRYFSLRTTFLANSESLGVAKCCPPPLLKLNLLGVVLLVNNII